MNFLVYRRYLSSLILSSGNVALDLEVKVDLACGSFSDDFDLIVTDNVQDHTILQHLH